MSISNSSFIFQLTIGDFLNPNDPNYNYLSSFRSSSLKKIKKYSHRHTKI